MHVPKDDGNPGSYNSPTFLRGDKGQEVPLPAEPHARGSRFLLFRPKVSHDHDGIWWFIHVLLMFVVIVRMLYIVSYCVLYKLFVYHLSYVLS